MRSNFPAASWSRSFSTIAVSAETEAVVNLAPSVAGTELVVSAALARPLRLDRSLGLRRGGAGFGLHRGFGRGNTSLMLGGGRSALSGIGTAAVISASDAAKALPA